ncbi:hypothetical protein EOY42_25285 [Salmonella enterica]|nr:hypothetical protein [Salmonella enterica]
MKKLLLAATMLAATSSVTHAKTSADVPIKMQTIIEEPIPAPSLTWTPLSNINWGATRQTIGSITLKATGKTCFYADGVENGYAVMKSSTSRILIKLHDGDRERDISGSKLEGFGSTCITGPKTIWVVRPNGITRPQAGTYEGTLYAYTSND